jgi:hypothetical protein
MATYIKESSKGKTLHLIRVDNIAGNTPVYLDATKMVRDAEHFDLKNGYKNGGPNLGIEIERARDYADYVGEYASVETLHQFYCPQYFLFSERAA